MPKLVRLSGEHRADIEAFTCSNTVLNRFLCHTALKENQKAGGKSTTYLYYHSNSLVGYFSICPASVSRQVLPSKTLQKNRYEDVTGYLIARLAVDCRFEGKGYGKALLLSAQKKIVTELIPAVNAEFIMVDYKDGKASFYEQFGFVCCQGERTKRMIIPVKRAVAILQEKHLI